MKNKSAIIHGPTISLIVLVSVVSLWACVEKSERKPSKINFDTKKNISYDFLNKKDKITIDIRSPNE